ncbi:MAG: Protein fmp52, mitochondrial [Candelina submexicana]|nr:MAG: Protein fmp52, mitochondrial [Candelina submexicana]
MATAAVVGSTGLVGSQILSSLLLVPTIGNVFALSRKPLKAADTSNKLQSVINTDSSKWASELSYLKTPPQIFFSGLATTRAQAGGFENQRKIDYDLNLELAKAAKERGVKVYVLISVATMTKNAMLNRMFAYPRMKAELEDAVKELGFEHTILVKPGLLVGDRDDSRPAEAALKSVAQLMGAISGGVLKDFWAQDADVTGKAAVIAGLRCLEGQAPTGKVWEVGQKEIVRLGKTEWKYGNGD